MCLGGHHVVISEPRSDGVQGAVVAACAAPEPTVTQGLRGRGKRQTGRLRVDLPVQLGFGLGLGASWPQLHACVARCDNLALAIPCLTTARPIGPASASHDACQGWWAAVRVQVGA